MTLRALAAAAGIAVALPSFAQAPDAETYTLYRDSLLDPSMRIHVASFDTSEGVAYNRENCMLARDLFLAQPGVARNFWCEPGRYRAE